MQEKKDTIVDGEITGKKTESGNNIHNADGTFGNKADTNEEYLQSLLEQENETHKFDTDVAIPLFEKNGMKVINQKLEKFNTMLYDIREAFPQQGADFYDRLGIDYFFILNEAQHGIDLKTIRDYNGEETNILTFPIWKFDPKSNKGKGKHIYGWFASPNKLNDAYIFQMLNGNNEVTNTYFFAKEKLNEFIFEQYFSRDFETLDSGFEKEIKEPDEIINEIFSMEKKPRFYKKYSIVYDEKQRPVKMYKTLPSSTFGRDLKIKITFDYVENEPKKNIILLCDKNYLLNRLEHQKLNSQYSPDEFFKKYLKGFTG